MSSQRVFLVMVLTAILSGYVGWFYAKKVDSFSMGTFEVRGPSDEIALTGPDQPNQMTPTIAVTQCGIGKFVIHSQDDADERALIHASDLTPAQVSCLIEKAQTELPGDQPPPWYKGAEAPKIHSHRPLLISFNKASGTPVRNDRQSLPFWKP